jgi:hypothetical protein
MGAGDRVETTTVQCPYCLEHVEVAFETDVHGSFVQDCEVCCQPWQLSVTWVDERLDVQLERAQ